MASILVAQRLSIIMHADCIYVLERRRIAETGWHAKLLAERWWYFAIRREQRGEWQGGASGDGVGGVETPNES